MKNEIIKMISLQAKLLLSTTFLLLCYVHDEQPWPYNVACDRLHQDDEHVLLTLAQPLSVSLLSTYTYTFTNNTLQNKVWYRLSNDFYTNGTVKCYMDHHGALRGGHKQTQSRFAMFLISIMMIVILFT